jgi:hypothetical protein
LCDSEVLLVGGKALSYRIGPADLLQASRDVGVIQVRIVAALAADDLEHAGMAALYPAVHEACGLAPQKGGAAMSELSSGRERGGTVPGIRRSRRCRDAIPAVRRPNSTIAR